MPIAMRWVQNDGSAIVLGGVNVTSAPVVSAVGDTSVTVQATTGEATTLYVAVYSENYVNPGKQGVVLGTGAIATATANLNSGVQGTATVTGLEPETDYAVFALLQNGSGIQSIVYQLTATTDENIVQVTAAPAIASTIGTSITVSATLAEAGALFVSVYADGQVNPGVVSVVAGSGAVAFNNGALTANTPGTVTVTGLNANTNYEVFCVLQDGSGVRTTVYELSATSGLDFSALTALEPSLFAGVQTACQTAATLIGSGTTAQDIADALGRAPLILNHRQSYTNTDATTIASVGNSIAGWKDWKDGAIATQADVGNRPTLASDGLSFDGLTDFMLMTDRAAIRLAGGGGIIVRFNETGGFRILQKGDGTGISADDYFASSSSVLSLAGCFQGDIAANTGLWTLLTGFWNGTLIRRYQNGVEAPFTAPSGGSVVSGGADPSAAPVNSADALYIGKRNNPSGSEGHTLGKIQSIIYYTTEADRTLLEGFVNAYQ